MSPIRGEEFNGRSVEEAIERGLRALGKKRTEVDIEILERGKPANMLGIGGEDARVLLSFQEEEREPEPEPVVDEAEVPRRPDAMRAREEREVREDLAGSGEPAEPAETAVPLTAEELAAGAEVLRELLEKMGVQSEVIVDEAAGQQSLDVKGPDLGVLIGRGGENLIALQQIASAVTSKRLGHTVHVPVDIEGYRRRREDQLRDIALRVAGRVRATGQAMTLEPMLAYERRIVHLAVQNAPGVRTESVGVDPNRRVVISSTAPGARPPAPFRPRPQGGGFRPRPGGFAPRPGGFGPRPGFRPRPQGGPIGPRPGGFRPRPGLGPRTPRDQ